MTSEEANDIEAHHKDFRWILMSWDLQQTVKEQGLLDKVKPENWEDEED